MSLGSPSVTFLSLTPAKWKVLSVICVPGSPIDCAVTTPTASPGSAIALPIRSRAFFRTLSIPSLLSRFSERVVCKSFCIFGLSSVTYFATTAFMSCSVALLPSSSTISLPISLEILTASPWSLFAGSIPSSPYKY